MKLAAACALSGAVLTVPALAPLTIPAAAAATVDESGTGSAVYCRWLASSLAHLQDQLPAITRSAAAAAQRYVRDGDEIATRGDAGIVGEAGGRAGGLMNMGAGNRVTDPQWHGIVLLFPQEELLAQDLAVAAASLQQSQMVVGFGRRPVLAAATQTGLKFTAFIETSPAPAAGVLKIAPDRWTIPADPVLNMAALWTWTGEFIAACTRLGKMPPVYQSFAVPGARERAKKYQGLKFHDGSPPPLAPGQVGARYLASLQASLARLEHREINTIHQVAAKAVAARRSGHTAYVSVLGHAIISNLSLPHDPGCFVPLNQGWATLKKDALIHQGDFIFCVGYDGGTEFAPVQASADQVGADLAWSTTDYRKDPATGRPPGIRPGQLFVNQHWELGDAVVAIPGYDIKILPPSGVLAEAVLRLVEAEMVSTPGPEFISKPLPP